MKQKEEKNLTPEKQKNISAKLKTKIKSLKKTLKGMEDFNY